MKIIINIQSTGDLITNSSSECYIINSEQDISIFEDLWLSFLREHGYLDKNNNYIGPHPDLAYTFIGDWFKDDEGIHLDFLSMCNVDEDIEAWLDSVFGSENVTRTL